MIRVLGALLLLAGCASIEGEQCAPPTDPMRVNELFFGRDIPGRGPLSDAEWSGFVASVVARAFPSGFTVLDGEGQWFDPASRTVTHEKSKIMVIATPREEDVTSPIADLRRAYADKYRQTSVGLLTYDACGAF